MQQIVNSVKRKKQWQDRSDKIGFNYKSVAFVKRHLHPFLQAFAGLWFLVMCFADRAHSPLLQSPAPCKRRLDKLPYWFLHPSASPTNSIYQRPQFSSLGLFIFSNNETERIISCCTCKSMHLLTLFALEGYEIHLHAVCDVQLPTNAPTLYTRTIQFQWTTSYKRLSEIIKHSVHVEICICMCSYSNTLIAPSPHQPPTQGTAICSSHFKKNLHFSFIIRVTFDVSSKFLNLSVEMMCKLPLNSGMTPHYLVIMLIALNKEHLDTLMEIWSIVSGCT